MDNSIEIIGVSKEVNKKRIIDNVSLKVKKGEVFGFLGPNGAGKTTLIRIIVGLISMTEGNVVINGKSIKDEFEEAIKTVGALVESPALYTHLSGYNNLKIFSNMHDNITEKDIDEVLKLVNLDKGIKQKVKNYSLGMKQRLGIAIALLHNPSILILDEPTNGLDPKGIYELRVYLRDLAAKKQITVIVSSHLLSEMELMCDRFAIINNGKIVDITSKDMYNNREEGALEYLIDVNDAIKAFNILKNTYNVSLFENKLKLNVIREHIPTIISELSLKQVKIYSVIPKNNSLEQYYFDVIDGKDIN
ncbi:ABC transporter ATP-binding protein [Hathewaya massiliensis]|uniref:ABC transporter ATP-binding protein n=1 Tax=Hathewaya massiliensis TaxID=1964382 RepID=UPI001158972F|nr:ABC transporter ATP-binding protein [Hathewaya massiliensis]